MPLRKPEVDSERPVPAKGSSRAMMADPNALRREFLGRHIPYSLAGSGKSGKAAVMRASSASGDMPKFNRMSGIAEWRNAVALFVNLSPDGDYHNVFVFPDGTPLEDAVEEPHPPCLLRMMWFAQARQTELSPPILRLIGGGMCVPDAAVVPGDKPTEHMLLFCRAPDQPYVYCGRVAYVQHDKTDTPMSFMLTLLDTFALWEHDTFRKLVVLG